MIKRLLFLLVFSLTACTTIGPPGATPVVLTPAPTETTPAPLPTQTPIDYPVVDDTPTPMPATYYFFEQGVNPLTGMTVPDPTLLDRRPVMVKVSNWPREGRPHAGLTSADIVFEYFIGHQMNRFLAIFYGENASQIGPIRSGRLVDAQLTNLYQGILAYGNADPQVDEVLIEALGNRAFAFNLIPCPAMCGESTYAATGVFANSSAITEHARTLGVEDNSAPDLRGMFFQTEPPLGDESGLSLRVEYANFSIMQWQYNEETGNYHLWMEAQKSEGLVLEPMTDRNNNHPVAFDNLVVMYAEYIEYASTLHNIFIQDVHDYQPALLFRDGSVTYGTWRVPVPDRPIIFETPEGGSLPFKPGNTWIVIVGMSSQTFQPDAGKWEIYFDLP